MWRKFFILPDGNRIDFDCPYRYTLDNLPTGPDPTRAPNLGASDAAIDERFSKRCTEHRKAVEARMEHCAACTDECAMKHYESCKRLRLLNRQDFHCPNGLF